MNKTQMQWIGLIGIFFLISAAVATALDKMEQSSETIITAGLLLGIIYTTAYPWYEKWKSGAITGFNPAYIVTAVFTFVILYLALPQLLSDFAPSDANLATFTLVYEAMMFSIVALRGINYTFLDSHANEEESTTSVPESTPYIPDEPVEETTEIRI